MLPVGSRSVEVRVLELLEVFERIRLDANGKARHHFVVLDYLCEVVRGEASAGSDAIEVAWAAADELERYSLTEATTQVILRAFVMTGERDQGPHE